MFLITTFEWSKLESCATSQITMNWNSIKKQSTFQNPVEHYSKLVIKTFWAICKSHLNHAYYKCCRLPTGFRRLRLLNFCWSGSLLFVKFEKFFFQIPVQVFPKIPSSNISEFMIGRSNFLIWQIPPTNTFASNLYSGVETELGFANLYPPIFPVTFIKFGIRFLVV